MVFKAKTKEHRYKQVGKLYLRRWKFYEKHISYFMNSEEKDQVVSFFQAMKLLDHGEVDLLAERYYKGEIYHRYNKELGDFTSVKPKTLTELAERFDCEFCELSDIYGAIEIKIGQSIIEGD